MSQHQIPVRQSHHLVVVGWDEPLGTFFGQVFDTTIPEEPENIVLWVGRRSREFRTVSRLATALRSYAALSPRIVRRLRQDQRWECDARLHVSRHRGSACYEDRHSA